MARRTDPKAQIAAGVSTLTLAFMWPMLNSFEQFTVLFEGDPTNLFIATLFLCVINASIVGGVAYIILATVERV